MKEESDEFHEPVIRTYRELAENESKRVVLIDGRISVEAIEQQVWNVLTQHFPNLGRHQIPNIRHQTS